MELGQTTTPDCAYDNQNEESSVPSKLSVKPAMAVVASPAARSATEVRKLLPIECIPCFVIGRCFFCCWYVFMRFSIVFHFCIVGTFRSGRTTLQTGMIFQKSFIGNASG